MPSPTQKLTKKHHHHIILCDCKKDEAQELTEYLKETHLLFFSRPYGINKKFWCQGKLRPSDAAIDVISALINFNVDVYQEGYTFNGQLSIEDFYWLSRSKSVKISSRTFRRKSVKATETNFRDIEAGAMKDFKSLSSTITSKVFRIVPKELQHLLKLMTKDPIRHINLIKSIILLNDEEKIARYDLPHQKLVLAKMLDEQMYLKALEYLECGACNKYQNWQNAVLHHPGLLQVFSYKQKSLLPANEEGASTFGRHCCHHLTKYAIEEEEDSKQNKQNNQTSNINAQEATNKTIKYSLGDIFPILDCFMPELFSQLQEGIFEIIELLYPQRLQMLRNKKTGGA